MDEAINSLYRITNRLEQQDKSRTRFNNALVVLRLVLSARNLLLAKQMIRQYLVSEEVEGTPEPFYDSEEVDSLSELTNSLLDFGDRAVTALEQYELEHKIVMMGKGVECPCGKCANTRDLTLMLRVLTGQVKRQQSNLVRSSTNY